MANIPTPQEFSQTLAQTLAPDVGRAVESLLAAMMKEGPYGSGYVVNSYKVTVDLQRHVAKAFAEKGWTVDFQGSYQGEWIKVTPKS